ncbi:MAG TPA: coenzyme F420-0:L-glutamate ligase [Actinomycetota bacterium]|nr:coenzyme F420-0:L-glutamate ligase [Actinomycetota bacterium]
MSVEIFPVGGLPEFGDGDDLAGTLADAVASLGPRAGDVLAVTQKVVSKAEGRIVRSDDARAHAVWVERETRRVVARRGDLVIAETRHGLVCANAGVDASNVANGWLTLLPEDPDASAETIRAVLVERFGAGLGVVITDTFGRPWREGLVNVAIGCAGLPAAVDLRGSRDHHGRVLDATVVALADEIAAASGLVMTKAARVPAALVRGVDVPPGVPASAATSLVREVGDDLFRESPLWAVASTRDLDAFGAGEVPRDVLVEAMRAVAPRGVAFVAATSDAARARVRAAIRDDGARALVATAVAALVPSTTFDGDDALVEGGRAVGRLAIALHAQGVGSAWIPRSHVDVELIRSTGDDVGSRPLGVLALGRTRTEAASPRPPSDPSAPLRFE